MSRFLITLYFLNLFKADIPSPETTIIKAVYATVEPSVRDAALPANAAYVPVAGEVVPALPKVSKQ